MLGWKKKAIALEVELNELKARFAPAIDAESAVKKITDDAGMIHAAAEAIYEDAKKDQEQFAEVKKQLREAEEQAERHLETLGVLGARAMLVDRLEIDPAMALRESERDVKKVQQQLDAAEYESAMDIDYTFTANGSKAQGRKAQNDIMALAQRAFDGECKRIIKAVSARSSGDSYAINSKTVTKGAYQIHSAASKINSSITWFNVSINRGYVKAKMLEATLAHEIKKRDAHRRDVERQEKAILRKERQLERENKQLIKDAEKAAKDETKAQEMLDKARSQLVRAHGAQLAQMQENMKRLQAALEEAHARNERAQSMAQITRAGHVYVISNVGSFGENVFKIGMTRRLEPQDRVRELGDASVPFRYDTHAIIWSEDAPALEAQLHQIFHNRRVNMANNRREFFRVTLDDIKSAIEEHGIDADVRTSVISEEYFESEHIRHQLEGNEQESLLDRIAI